METYRNIVAYLALLLCLVGLVGCEPASAPETATGVEFDLAKIPEELRILAPLAKKWGIGDDMLRAETIERASSEERQALREAVEEHSAGITRWLDSFGSGADMPDEAAAYMYMQLAVEELPL